MIQQSMKFHWSVFPMLEEMIVNDAFPEAPAEVVSRGWIYWQKSFLRRAHLAYGSALHHHEAACRREYATRHGFVYEEPFFGDAENDYRAFLYSSDFGNHLRAVERFDAKADRIWEKLNAGQMYAWVDSVQLMQEYRREFSDLRTYGCNAQSIANKLDEWWFNSAIYTEPDEIYSLRTMPYRDYLQTGHWRRVRSAMLLIHNARCQSERCAGMDGYWLDESFMHVHHKSYLNRGQERYADLMLLCERCHEIEHGIEAAQS